MCYHPNLLIIYSNKNYPKKITKFIKNPNIENYGKYINDNINQYKYIKWTDKKTKKQYQDYCLCEDITLIPCNNCIACSKSKSRNWTTRLLLENIYHKNGYFVTLTYDDEHLPKNYNISKNDMKEFIKKLKNYAYRNNLLAPVYYIVSEYGSKTQRPHYHMLLWDTKLDLKPVTKTLCECKELEKIWNKGQISVGFVAPASAAYVSQYTNKKTTRTLDEKELMKQFGIEPECMMCSRGIGKKYYIENFDNIIKNEGKLYINGNTYMVDRYFYKLAKQLGREEEVKQIKYENYIHQANKFAYAHNFGHTIQNQLLYEEHIAKNTQQLKNR